MRKQWLFSLLVFLITASALILATTSISAAPPAQGDKLPVLLVHGVCGAGENGPNWGVLTSTLTMHGFTFKVIDLRDADLDDKPDELFVNNDIRIYADRLRAQVDQFRQEVYGPNYLDGQIDIVAHSLGGLVSRCFITDCDTAPGVTLYDDSVRTLVMMGTPNFGSRLTYIRALWKRWWLSSVHLPLNPFLECLNDDSVDSVAIHQLRPGSLVLNQLNAPGMPDLRDDLGVDVHLIAGTDNILTVKGRHIPFVLGYGDGVVRVNSVRLKDYPLYLTRDDHLGYSENPSTAQLVVDILLSQAPALPNFGVFEYWPVSPYGQAYTITEVTDKANFLQNNVTSDYGFRNVTSGSKYHFGLNVRTVNAQGNNVRGLPIIAVAGGEVKFINSNGCNANVVIYHPQFNVYTQYLGLSTINVRKNDTVSATQQIGTSGPSLNCSGAGFLGFRVRHSLSNTGRAFEYLNPLLFYPAVNLDEPHVSDIKIRTGNSGPYIALSNVEAFRDGVLELGSQDIWLAFKVSTRDRDIDNVSVLFDDNPSPLYSFNYHTGGSGKSGMPGNNTMSLVSTSAVNSYASTAGYVSTGSLEAGSPSEDWFYYHLYSPDDKRMENLLDNRQPHLVWIRAVDMLDNDNDPAEGSFWVQLAQ